MSEYKRLTNKEWKENYDMFEYQRGVQGKTYGIFDRVKKEFCFGIYEETPMLAEARLFQK